MILLCPLLRREPKGLSHIARFLVSDLLERKASQAEKKEGWDLADYLIKFNYKDFTLSNKKHKHLMQ
jgi:hypothetical protein